MGRLAAALLASVVSLNAAIRTTQLADVVQPPRIGAAVAVHPPKFPLLAIFLEQRANCQAAREAMSLHVVFSSQKDLDSFTQTFARVSPKASSTPDNWVPVVATVPKRLGNSDQHIAAWKKWYGIATLMDLGAKAPEYGLMLDAELRLYDPQDCGPESAWLGLHSRLEALEHSKSWPAAKVGRSVKYNLGPPGDDNNFITGQEYDRQLIQENVDFVLPGKLHDCTSLGCRVLEGQLDNVLFSWWTDLPYLNLKVAARMLSAVSSQQPKAAADTSSALGHWQRFVSGISFPRFEHVAYQQWCVLHEGYSFRDVTPLVGEAKWGSYLEDAPDHAHLSELHPLWVSGNTFSSIKDGRVPPMNATERPLLLFHVDHLPDLWPDISFVRSKWKQQEGADSMLATSQHHAGRALAAEEALTVQELESHRKNVAVNLLEMFSTDIQREKTAPIKATSSEPATAEHSIANLAPSVSGAPLPHSWTSRYHPEVAPVVLAILSLLCAAAHAEFKHFIAVLYLATSVGIDMSIAMQKSHADTGEPSRGLYEFNPMVAVLLTEVIKLCVSVACFALTPRTDLPSLPSLADVRWLCFPAVIFTANNILVWWAIGENDVGVFGVFRDSMILWTAAFWCIVYRTSLGGARLAAIGVVFAGLVVNRAGSIFGGSQWSWAFIWVLGMTLCNVTGSVANEYALKRSQHVDINLQNSALYVACIFFSSLLLLRTQPEALWHPQSLLTGVSRWTLLTCVLQACAGLLVSRLLKYTDAVWKTAAACLRGPFLVFLSWFMPGQVGQRDVTCLVSAVIVAAGSFWYLLQGPMASQAKPGGKQVGS